MLNVGRIKEMATDASSWAAGHPKTLLGLAGSRRARQASKFIGKKSIKPLMGLGVAGAVVGGAVHSTFNNTDPRSTPFMDSIFEAVTGNAQIDRALLGSDVGLGDMFQGPWSRPAFMRNMQLVNPMSANYMASFDDGKYPRNAAQTNVDRGYSSYPYPNTTMPYRPTSSRRLNATGNIVLGLHNAR
jgi:hypothetical protein